MTLHDEPLEDQAAVVRRLSMEVEHLAEQCATLLRENERLRIVCKDKSDLLSDAYTRLSQPMYRLSRGPKGTALEHIEFFTEVAQPMDYTGPTEAPKDTIFRYNAELETYTAITLKDAIDAQDQNVIAFIRDLIALLEAALDFSNTTLDKLAQVHRVDINREIPFELVLRKQDLDRKLKELKTKI